MAKKKTTSAAVDRVAKAQKSFLLASIQADRQNLLLSIQNLEERIISLAQKRLQTDDSEKLLGPKVNLKMAQQLHQDLTKEFDRRYGTAARTVVDGYEAIAKNIRNSWSDLNLAVKYTAVDQDMMDTLRTSYYNEFKKFGLDAQNKMVRAMYDAVAGQSSFAVLADAISAALTGQRAKNGRPMSTYANMFAHDATMNFHNAVTLKKADDAGINNFLYYGNLMNTSRDFCIERAGKKFSKAQIDSWTFPWAGKSGPAMTHRGGYNCRHHWMPFRPEWVGKEPRLDPMRIVGRMLGCIKK